MDAIIISKKSADIIYSIIENTVCGYTQPGKLENLIGEERARAVFELKDALKR